MGSIPPTKVASVRPSKNVSHSSGSWRILRLLTVAESHQLSFEKREVDLVDIAQRSIGMFQPEADENKVNLDLGLSIDKALVIADPIRTEQAIGNLLSNARQYIPAGGRIWIDISRQGEELAISINDNGPGVAENDLPFIFKRFGGEKNPVHAPRAEPGWVWRSPSSWSRSRTGGSRSQFTWRRPADHRFLQALRRNNPIHITGTRQGNPC